jgi:hypothetical protein
MADTAIIRRVITQDLRRACRRSLAAPSAAIVQGPSLGYIRPLPKSSDPIAVGFGFMLSGRTAEYRAHSSQCHKPAERGSAWQPVDSITATERAVPSALLDHPLAHPLVTVLEKGMGYLVPDNCGQCGFILRNGQKAGIDHDLTTGHAPGIRLLYRKRGCIPTYSPCSWLLKALSDYDTW